MTQPWKWIPRTWSSSKGCRRAQPRTFRPRLEGLETRLTPSLFALASFNGTDGSEPLTGLIADSSGNLYGTTDLGGAANLGTVFEMAHGTRKITTLASFSNGSGPGSLIIDKSGNLYDTTFTGGAANDGTVFELVQGSGTITTLASFNGADGIGPTGGLIRDGSGNLYGLTKQGGAANDGTVFELVNGSGTITTLASFRGKDGADPEAGLIADRSGNLYGTTNKGGASHVGTVFELAHGHATITTLASFNGGANGANPTSGLIVDRSGNLYGTTALGGTSGNGQVFEVVQGSGTISTLASFNGTNGFEPNASLIMDSNGNLYGTATLGGAAGDGTVFEVAQGSGTITALASFNGTNGAFPESSLIRDSRGNLYGTAFQGGASNDGTVFELSMGAAQKVQGAGATFAVGSEQPTTARLVSAPATRQAAASVEIGVLAARYLGPKQPALVSVDPVKSPAGGQAGALTIGDIDQLFAGEPLTWRW
jgi:uncharacterized repeat protein (TIGR03803 family)